MPPWSNTVGADETRPEPDRARRRGARRRLRARTGGPGGRPGGRACEAVRAGGAPGGADGAVRARRAVRADERRTSCSETTRSRCAARGTRRPWSRSARPPTISPAASSATTSTSRANPLKPGCEYEQWAQRISTGSLPTTYARVVGEPVSPRAARAPVLVLLRLQRLQRQARGRLGDDPARLRRAAMPSRRWRRSPPRSATASTREPSAPAGATPSSSSSTAPTRSCTRLPARTRTTTGRPSTSAAAPPRASAATTPSGRRASCARPSPSSRPAGPRTSPRTPGSATTGRWGEQQPGFYNGPTGPNTKTQWTEPITWAETDLARHGLRGPRRAARSEGAPRTSSAEPSPPARTS